MSIALLSSTLKELPYSLREQVLGYAESVAAAAPSIAAEVGIDPSQQRVDELVFLAGIRKLYGLVASSYWALDNSTSLLTTSGVHSVRVGTQDYSRGSSLHTSLKDLFEALDHVLEREGLREYLDLPYSELLQQLVRRGSE